MLACWMVMERIQSNPKMVVAAQCTVILLALFILFFTFTIKINQIEKKFANITHLSFEIDNQTTLKIDVEQGSLAYMYNYENIVLFDLATIKHNPSHLLKCLKESIESLPTDDYVDCDIQCTKYSMGVCLISPEDGTKLHFSPSSVNKIIMIINMICSSL